MTDITKEAKILSDELKKDFKQHDLTPLLTQVKQDRSNMSPQDFSKLLASFGNDSKSFLHGLTIEDLGTPDKANLVIKAPESSIGGRGITPLIGGTDGAAALGRQISFAEANLADPEAYVRAQLQGATLESTDDVGRKIYRAANGERIIAAPTELFDGPGTIYEGSAPNSFIAQIQDDGSSSLHTPGMHSGVGVEFDHWNNQADMYDNHGKTTDVYVISADGSTKKGKGTKMELPLLELPQ